MIYKVDKDFGYCHISPHTVVFTRYTHTQAYLHMLWTFLHSVLCDGQTKVLFKQRQRTNAHVMLCDQSETASSQQCVYCQIQMNVPHSNLIDVCVVFWLCECGFVKELNK